VKQMNNQLWVKSIKAGTTTMALTLHNNQISRTRR
jgi:hypothetical protein